MIPEAEVETTHHLQLDRISPLEYSDDLLNKALRCVTVYTEDRLKEFSIDGFLESI